MTQRHDRRTWLAGLAIIVLTNAVALGGVAYNRAGTPESGLVLTERELEPAYRTRLERENSGISLQLNWRTNMDEVHAYVRNGHWSQPDWLDRGKLGQLGFDVDGIEGSWEARRRFNQGLQREVYVVLEYEGQSWRRMLEQVRDYYEKARALADKNPGEENLADAAEKAGERLAREERSASRLFAIDAGTDADALRRQYPDRGLHVIAAGRVKPYMNNAGRDRWDIGGTLMPLAITRVHVDAGYRDLFEGLAGDEYEAAPLPRYTARLAWGRRLEPWVVGIEAVDGADPAP